MEIIAHRGFWKDWEERNHIEAFRRAVSEDIGTETDFRDYRGKLVVSHDVADENSIDAEEFFALYAYTSRTLALNIKSDGIQVLLMELLKKYSIRNYFCFDMSVPDTLSYLNHGLSFFTRQSEYEVINDLYNSAAGVWVDGFIDDDWISLDLILNHRNNGKKVCIVSSELHRRDHAMLWERIKRKDILNDDGVILCTDYPDKAKELFYG